MMKKKPFKKTMALLLCCAVMYILLCLSGLLDKQKIWQGVPVDYPQQKQALSLAEGDAYGIMTAGPYYELPAGTYRLKWQIEGDGVNAVRLIDTNEVEISPARFETVPGAFEGEAVFELKDTVHNFVIQVDFCDGTWISVHNFRLYSPVYTDHYISLAAVMLAVVLLALLHESGRLGQDRRITLAVVLLAVCFASVPALREDTIYVHDVPFHAVRLHNLLDSLSSGQFPARVGGYSYNGYGAVTSVFYPDMLLYPFALLLYLGASMAYVLNMLTLTMNALAALSMYIAAKRMFADWHAGVFAAIVYVCCGFRLDRLYGSFMVGQMLAMAFVPLFILGLWEVFFGDKARWPMLVLGATLIFQSHMLTTMMCAGVAAAAFVCFGWRLIRERRIGALALAGVMTVLVNLTTLVPLAMTYLSGVTTSVGTYGFISLTHEMVQMLGTDKELGLAMALGLAALVCADRETVGRARMHTAIVLAVLGAVCVFLCTDLFPWSHVFALTNNFFEILQFSWRFLAIATPALALCAGLGYACLLKKEGAKGMLAVLAVAILCATPIIEGALEKEIMEYGLDGSPYMLTPEYQFEGTDLAATRSRQVITQGDVQLTGYEKNGTQIYAYVEAKDNGSLTFPLFGFDGYEVRLNGEKIDWARGENNRLAVALDAGMQGELSVRYGGHMIWRIADGISLLTLAGLCVFCCRKRGTRG
ncbi:MAG: hypothetical protein IKU38_00130 [Clostridia bacterium]|nr:hypothetical protein [Clostridia bacterium]